MGLDYSSCLPSIASVFPSASHDTVSSIAIEVRYAVLGSPSRISATFYYISPNRTLPLDDRALI